MSSILDKLNIQEQYCVSMKKKILRKNMSYEIFKKHDHGSCFKTTLVAFENHCSENGLQCTPLRRKVLEFLLKDHRPIGAYEILDLLRQEGLSSKPPIAYRVLDFLIEQGFAHKIQGLNAFVACSFPGDSHSPAFMICRKCEKVAEMEDRESGINLKKTSLTEFKIEEAFIEIRGICNSCIELETK